MSAELLESIPGVVDVARVGGGPVVLVIEVPHGATRREDFEVLRAQMKGAAFPPDLIDFFFVNTDVGAPEAAYALADELAKRVPGKSVVVLRCRIPRTLIDTNRVIDEASKPTASTATGMTPGVVRYVTEPDDFAVLYAKYAAYRAKVTAVLARFVGGEGDGEGGALALMLHSYAPRSVDIPVDEKIVERLHDAYKPEVEPTWPLRADVDLISKDPDGNLLAPAALVHAVREAFTGAGHVVTECGTYPLHPSSLAHVFATRWPERVLCLELRRDLLVRAFTPFDEMPGDPQKCARIGALLADAFVPHVKAR